MSIIKCDHSSKTGFSSSMSIIKKKNHKITSLAVVLMLYSCLSIKVEIWLKEIPKFSGFFKITKSTYSHELIIALISFYQCSIIETNVDRINELIEVDRYLETHQFMSLKNFYSGSFYSPEYLSCFGLCLEITNENDSPTPYTPILILRNGISNLNVSSKSVSILSEILKGWKSESKLKGQMHYLFWVNGLTFWYFGKNHFS